MASNQRQRRRSAGLQRLALLAFGGILIVLILGFAVTQGIGNPSPSSGEVAIVEDAPEGLGTITEEEFQHRLDQAAAAAQVKPVPEPGDRQYDELKETALGELFDSVWLQGLAEEMDITVTEQEIADELKKLKKQTFKSEAEYKAFLKKSHFTPEDVDERVRIQILSQKIQKKVSLQAPTTPTSSEIEEYYEAAKDSQFTQPATRDARIVVNKDRGKVEAAKAELEKDNSVGNWGKVAKKYSTDVATKTSGGLSAGLTETPEPLNKAVFEAPTGQIEGPIEAPNGYIVFEVGKATPEKTQTLEEAKPQISGQLTEQANQQVFTRFIRNYGSTWRARTFCADDFTIERCANYRGDGRPAEANPACYEANPKGGPPTDCPAPVTQVKPAMPGSVSILEPEGKKLAQRPRPAGEEEAAPELPAGLPPGVAPPPGG
ncbi:MAG TPA: peptidyl-prolyl cis-trans isomerase [Solirubrobacterales bacterium]|nr:peptidyl-prolyl cis-trans isomerase [Solirubrobacterales bacterium]